MKSWSKRGDAAARRQLSFKAVVAVEPRGGGMVLALQVIIYRRLPRDLQDRLVTLTYPAVSAVDYQGG
jgi:hypothetical protein